MRVKYVVFSLFTLFLFIMFKVDSQADEISKEEAKRLHSFLNKRFGAQMPPDANIEIKGYEESPIKGFKKGSFVINSSRGSGQVAFIISQDGRYIILGESVNTEEFEDTPIGEVKKGSVPFLGSQPVPILISKDGKYIIIGDIVDSTIDPFKETMSKISLEDVPVKGDENAMVTIVEYSDFQCPFCKRGYEMIYPLLEEYEGKVKVAYKQLPLPIHNWAMNASIASVCAQKQGNDKFWEFHDLVFEKQKEITVENASDEFNGIAKEIGLNTEEFDKCLDSPEVAGRVKKEMEEARLIGVSSTPTFVVNGMIVPGANPAGLKSAIETSLSGDL